MRVERTVRLTVRWIVIGVVVVLAGLTVLFLRGPAFWQKAYYPLHYETQIADSASRHTVSPYLVAAVRVTSQQRARSTPNASRRPSCQTPRLTSSTEPHTYGSW